MFSVKLCSSVILERGAMPKLTDRDYLLSDQYKDAANLDARIQLHRRFSTNRQGWMAWVFERIRPPADGCILELGCGPCDLWVENAGRIPPGWDVTLSDFSRGMVEQARENLHGIGRAFSFQVIDAQMIPYKNDVFDAVIANHMLFHVPDRDRALSEIQRVLRPGGLFYATTAGGNHLREIRELIRSVAPEIDDFDALPEFRLENGGEQLSRFFPHVALHRYDDGLAVTEPKPLVAYLLSTRHSAALRSNDNLEKLTRLVEGKIESSGAIHIQKDSGMFEAANGPSVD
jgi:SAM-dependent methyltransferase